MQMISHQTEEIRLAGGTYGGSDELAVELERVLEQKRQLEVALDNEKAGRQQLEDNLKLQMGEEQRTLIQQAESSMQKLRKDLGRLEEGLKRSEAEAYTAREDNEELRDQGKRALQNAIQMESKVAALQNENARLKRAVEDQELGKQGEAASLALELKKGKSERASAQQSLIKLENKLRLAEQEKNEKERELSSVLENISRLDVPALEKENRRLQDEVKTLSSQAAAMKELSSESSGSRTEIRSLQTKLSELNELLKSKDDRIKKLAASKLTKEKVAAIKKMKVR
jgi:chromosome segregation ATPase